MEILDGKKISNQIKDEIAVEVDKIKKKATSKRVTKELNIDVKMDRIGGKILELTGEGRGHGLLAAVSYRERPTPHIATVLEDWLRATGPRKSRRAHSPLHPSHRETGRRHGTALSARQPGRLMAVEEHRGRTTEACEATHRGRTPALVEQNEGSMETLILRIFHPAIR